MNLYDLYQDWTHISYAKKIAALRGVVDFLEKNPDDEFLENFLLYPYDNEADDYFGTEGLRF